MFDDLSKVLEPITVNMVTTSESEDAVLHLGELYGSEKTVTIVEGDMIVGTEEHNTVIQPLLDKQKLQDEWPRLQGMIKGAYAKFGHDSNFVNACCCCILTSCPTSASWLL